MVVYETTNLINGKKYIGQDSHNNPNYLGSGKSISRAIKKYGKKNFEKKILEYCVNKKHLDEREEYWLQLVDAVNNPLYYNRTSKPFGGAPWNNNMKKQQSLKYKNREVTWGNKISQAKAGCVVSEERRKKVSESLKGRPRSENAGKEKISVLQYDLKGNFIKEWSSISEAKKWLGEGDIRACLKQMTKKAGGYVWKYK